MQKLLKAKLKERVVTIGSWVTLGDNSVAEIMAKSGFNWLAVDMEHSAITLKEAQSMIRVIELAGRTPLVRVSENDRCLIKRVMDAGAHGVIVPMINNKEDALKAVDAVKYPPDGRRGVGLARAQGYGLGFEKYKKRINNESIVVAQIESIEAIDNLKEILEVEGVDASIIGPYDLSASLGHPGEFERKEVKDAIKRYIKVCKELNKSTGLHVVSPVAKKLEDAIKKGFKFIGFGFDALFLGQKIKEELEKIKR